MVVFAKKWGPNLLRVPYTHRIDRENNQFQIMQKIFTGLENAFVGTGWSWKPHKSKEHIFLHRNYTQKNLNSEKNGNIFRSKKNPKNFRRKKIPEKSDPKSKNSDFQKKWFFENLNFDQIFREIFFVENFSENFFDRKISPFFFRSWDFFKV